MLSPVVADTIACARQGTRVVDHIQQVEGDLMKLDPKLTQHALSLLRIVSGYMILQHGTAKLFHVPHVAMFDSLEVFSLIGAAGIIELVGGVLLLIGVFTQPVAFILSGELAFAYFIGHAPHGNFFVPMLNQGELAVLYCFVFLLLAAAGGGSWSVDAMRRRTP
jgi:putative oxidoreductase